VPSTLVLSAGKDSTLLALRNLVLQSAGYTVVSAFSHKELITRFMDGDFDLVVLCHSIPAEEREQVAEWIRRHSPSTPVIVVSNLPHVQHPYADLTVYGDARDLIKAMPGVLDRSAG
jgi:DNA-binding response OmpR family regulator